MTIPSTTNLTMYEFEENEPMTFTSCAGIVAGISLHPENVFPSFCGAAKGVMAVPKAISSL